MKGLRPSANSWNLGSPGLSQPQWACSLAWRNVAISMIGHGHNRGCLSFIGVQRPEGLIPLVQRAREARSGIEKPMLGSPVVTDVASAGKWIEWINVPGAP